MDDMKLNGFKELAAALKELGPRVARNALRSAVSNGAALIRDEAKAKAPQSSAGDKSAGQSPSGTLKRAIAIKRDRDQKDIFNAKYSVFVRSNANTKSVKAYGRTDAFYARFLEFGTSKMSARPFLRPAFDQRKADAITAIGARLDEKIQQIATELSKK